MIAQLHESFKKRKTILFSQKVKRCIEHSIKVGNSSGSFDFEFDSKNIDKYLLYEYLFPLFTESNLNTLRYKVSSNNILHVEYIN